MKIINGIKIYKSNSELEEAKAAMERSQNKHLLAIKAGIVISGLLAVVFAWQLLTGSIKPGPLHFIAISFPVLASFCLISTYLPTIRYKEERLAPCGSEVLLKIEAGASGMPDVQTVLQALKVQGRGPTTQEAYEIVRLIASNETEKAHSAFVHNQDI